MAKKTIEIFNRTELKKGDVVVTETVDAYATFQVEREIPAKTHVVDGKTYVEVPRGPGGSYWEIGTHHNFDDGRHIALFEDKAWTYYVLKGC